MPGVDAAVKAVFSALTTTTTAAAAASEAGAASVTADSGFSAP
jgi:hypothetical protein